jgi:TonB family protein
MNRLILTVALLAGSLPLNVDTNPAPQQLFLIAERQANLFQDQSSPFQFDADFVVQMDFPTQGHLSMKWGANDRWWSKVEMGHFEQVNIRNGEKSYTSRNVPFTPVRIGEVFNLINFVKGFEDKTAKKLKHRAENGVDLSCLQVERQQAMGEPHEVCLDSTTHEILSEEWREQPDERRREEFTDYANFGGNRYPRKLQLQVNGSRVVTIQVNSLAASPLDEAFLVPPKGAVERRKCANMKNAMQLKTPDPLYPKSAGKNRLMGDSTVAMTVLTDGSVSDIQLIGRATESMDEATLQTLRSWRFKPAMCGADPVVSDIVVVVSFRLE